MFRPGLLTATGLVFCGRNEKGIYRQFFMVKNENQDYGGTPLPFMIKPSETQAIKHGKGRVIHEEMDR